MFTVHLVAKPMVLSFHFDRSIQFIKGVYFFILSIKAVAIGPSWLMFTFVLWGICTECGYVANGKDSNLIYILYARHILEVGPFPSVSRYKKLKVILDVLYPP